MKIVRNNEALEAFLSNYKLNNPSKSIGFVPTMGALHQGHISLINHAKTTSNLVVCSVFVNPTQFDKANDLENYPRTELADIEILHNNGCDVVYLPQFEDVYPEKNIDYNINLEGLDKVLEGKYRDGHFNGVCMVVERLLNLVQPDFAYFGLKDFQQVSIIKHMVRIRKLKTTIVPCPIIREKSGLAMSSRNTLLTDQQRLDATIINKTLEIGKKAYQEGHDYKKVREKMFTFFQSGNLELEYLEIVDNDTLLNSTILNSNTSICIAAYCGKIRLIDNCQF